jgi:hypothetical protein
MRRIPHGRNLGFQDRTEVQNELRNSWTPIVLFLTPLKAHKNTGSQNMRTLTLTMNYLQFIKFYFQNETWTKSPYFLKKKSVSS